MNTVDKLDRVLKSWRGDSRETHRENTYIACELMEHIEELHEDERWALMAHILKRFMEDSLRDGGRG